MNTKTFHSLIHWSNEPIHSLYNTIQPELGYKPKGLWVSDESSDFGWREWCIINSYPCGRIPHQVTIPDSHRILVLDTEQKVLDFSERFQPDIKNLHEYISLSNYDEYMEIYADYKLNKLPLVLWQRVAQFYDGIMISPYYSSLRYEPLLAWYNTWDCASGAIWNCIGVKIEPVLDWQRKDPPSFDWEL